MKRLVFGNYNTSGHSKGYIATRHKKALVKKKYYITTPLKNIFNTFSSCVVHNFYKNKSLMYNSKGFLYLNNSSIDNKKNHFAAQYSLNWNYLTPGNIYPIAALEKGSHCYHLYTNKNIASSYSYSTVMYSHNNYTIIKLPSKEIKIFNIHTLCKIGRNPHLKLKLKKAGQTRWLGTKSKVRGVAMNPVDHPHGGGEGKSKGKLSMSKWGLLSKGKKTRHTINKWLIRKR
jgi:hypothetical protein